MESLWSVNILEKLDCVIMRPTACIKGNMQIHTERREKAGEFPFKNTHSLPWRYIRNATAALEEDDSSDEAISSRGLEKTRECSSYFIHHCVKIWGKNHRYLWNTFAFWSLFHIVLLMFMIATTCQFTVFFDTNDVLASFGSHVFL